MRARQLAGRPAFDQIRSCGRGRFRVQHANVGPLGHVVVQLGRQTGQSTGIVRQPNCSRWFWFVYVREKVANLFRGLPTKRGTERIEVARGQNQILIPVRRANTHGHLLAGLRTIHAFFKLIEEQLLRIGRIAWVTAAQSHAAIGDGIEQAFPPELRA